MFSLTEVFWNTEEIPMKFFCNVWHKNIDGKPWCAPINSFINFFNIRSFLKSRGVLQKIFQYRETNKFDGSSWLPPSARPNISFHNRKNMEKRRDSYGIFSYRSCEAKCSRQKLKLRCYAWKLWEKTFRTPRYFPMNFYGTVRQKCLDGKT